MVAFDLHAKLCSQMFCQCWQIWKYSLYNLNNAIETISVRVLIGCVISGDSTMLAIILIINCIQ